MKAENTKCLVLNADYSPLTIISWQKAIQWSFKYEHNYKLGIEIIDFYKNDCIHGANNKKYAIPAVVKTYTYFRINNTSVKFSRKNLFIRDHYICQYCRKKFDINNLTYDHVIPKSAWLDQTRSPTNWTNIVTACISCNRKKGNKTPKQANMPLLTLPVMPQKNIKYLPIVSYLVKMKELPQEWILYLPESYI